MDREFILQHRDEDVRALALRYSVDGETLDQIRGWQVAKKKLPTWSALPDILYPPHLSMEQCSSEATARYKASLLTTHYSPLTLIDLTGGLGVDFSFMTQGFERAIYVERQEHLCELAKHNLKVLGLNQAEVVNATAEEWLETNKSADNIIYIDPARRDGAGRRTYAIEDCTPNIIELQEELRARAEMVIIKLSPMLDWRAAVTKLQNISDVHIVSVANECKELLLVMRRNPQELKVHCVNILSAPINITAPNGRSMNLVLLEPNASVMKAGFWSELEERFKVKQVARNSHLFLSFTPLEQWPGKQFEVIEQLSLNKRELKALQGKQFNIVCRNFPLSPEQLKAKLKTKDGGQQFLFATTDNMNNHVLYICNYLSSGQPELQSICF